MKSFVTSLRFVAMHGFLSEEINMLDFKDAYSLLNVTASFDNGLARSNVEIPMKAINIDSESLVSVLYGANGAGKTSTAHAWLTMCKIAKFLLGVDWFGNFQPDRRKIKQLFSNFSKIIDDPSDPLLESKLDFGDIQRKFPEFEYIRNGFTIEGVSQLDSEVIVEHGCGKYVESDSIFEINLVKLNKFDFFGGKQFLLLKKLDFGKELFGIEIKITKIEQIVNPDLPEDPFSKPLELFWENEEIENKKFNSFILPFFYNSSSKIITAIPYMDLYHADFDDEEELANINEMLIVFSDDGYHKSRASDVYIKHFDAKGEDDLICDYWPLQPVKGIFHRGGDYVNDLLDPFGFNQRGSLSEFIDSITPSIYSPDNFPQKRNIINRKKEKYVARSSKVIFDSWTLYSLYLMLNPPTKNALPAGLYRLIALQVSEEKDLVGAIRAVQEILRNVPDFRCELSTFKDQKPQKIYENFIKNDEFLGTMNLVDLLRNSIYSLISYADNDITTKNMQNLLDQLFTENIYPTLSPTVTTKGFPKRVNSIWSSGQKRLWSIMAALSEGDTNSPIIIDEPELSLHPNWQLNIHDIVVKISELSKRQCILITHSPEIVEGFSEDRTHCFEHQIMSGD